MESSKRKEAKEKERGGKNRRMKKRKGDKKEKKGEKAPFSFSSTGEGGGEEESFRVQASSQRVLVRSVCFCRDNTS